MDRRQRGPASLGAAPTARIGCYYALVGVKVAAVANRDDLPSPLLRPYSLRLLPHWARSKSDPAASSQCRFVR